MKLEIVRVLAIDVADPCQHVVTVFIDSRQWRLRVASSEKFETWRWNCQSFIWINFYAARVCDGDQLEVIEKHRFFELVSNAQLVTPVARLQEIAVDADVLIRVGCVVNTRRRSEEHTSELQSPCNLV